MIVTCGHVISTPIYYIYIVKPFFFLPCHYHFIFVVRLNYRKLGSASVKLSRNISWWEDLAFQVQELHNKLVLHWVGYCTPNIEHTCVRVLTRYSWPSVRVWYKSILWIRTYKFKRTEALAVLIFFNMKRFAVVFILHKFSLLIMQDKLAVTSAVLHYLISDKPKGCHEQTWNKIHRLLLNHLACHERQRKIKKVCKTE